MAVSASNHKQEQLQQVVTPTITITPTATGTPLPLLINTVEPNRMSAINGGVLTVLGQGFTPDAVVRLVGCGLLNTTFVNQSGLTAVVPPGVPPAATTCKSAWGMVVGPVSPAPKPYSLRLRQSQPTHRRPPTRRCLRSPPPLRRRPRLFSASPN